MHAVRVDAETQAVVHLGGGGRLDRGPCRLRDGLSRALRARVRARELLRVRLSRRGVTLAAGLKS